MPNLHINADYHTHTIFSHGKTSIEQNVERAKELNLKAVAITDHGFNQPFAGVNPKSFEKMQKIVADIKAKEKDIDILLGVEANLMNLDGRIDLTCEQFELMDIVLCGYHLTATQRRIKPLITTVIPAILGNMNICSENQKQKNTKAFVNMIKNYKIDVLTHPGFNLLVDYTEIGKVCADYGTYVEISSRHEVPNEKGLEELIKTDCKFIANSDAHKLEQIGQCEYALNLIEKYKLQDRVANINNNQIILRSKS